MAKSGISHIDTGLTVPKAAWLSEETHELIHGAEFPASPVERQLFYRDDEHKLYIYNGTVWVDATAAGGGASTFLGLTDTPAAYTGQSGKVATVKATEDGLEFGAGGGGVTDHGALTGLGDDDHPQYIKHSLATAVSNFLVASGAGVFVKKTLAEVKTLLNWAADIATHAGLTTGVHGAVPDEDILVGAFRRANYITIPTAAGWLTDLSTGSGTVQQEPMRNCALTGVTANSKGVGGTTFFSFNEDGNYARINWGKKLYFIFNYGRVDSDAQVIARVQIKTHWSEGALGAQGIGFKVLNYALWGESYGTELGEVDLGVTVTDWDSNQIIIVLDPGVSIKWYVNGVLKGTQSTAAKIPAGIATGTTYLVHSIKNGATGGTKCYSNFMQSKAWQER